MESLVLIVWIPSNFSTSTNLREWSEDPVTIVLLSIQQTEFMESSWSLIPETSFSCFWFTCFFFFLFYAFLESERKSSGIFHIEIFPPFPTVQKWLFKLGLISIAKIVPSCSLDEILSIYLPLSKVEMHTSSSNPPEIR